MNGVGFLVSLLVLGVLWAVFAWSYRPVGAPSEDHDQVDEEVSS